MTCSLANYLGFAAAGVLLLIGGGAGLLMGVLAIEYYYPFPWFKGDK